MEKLSHTWKKEKVDKFLSGKGLAFSDTKLLFPNLPSFDKSLIYLCYYNRLRCTSMIVYFVIAILKFFEDQLIFSASLRKH